MWPLGEPGPPPSQDASWNRVPHPVLVPGLGRGLLGALSPPHQVGLWLRGASEPERLSFLLDQTCFRQTEGGPRRPQEPSRGPSHWGCSLPRQAPCCKVAQRDRQTPGQEASPLSLPTSTEPKGALDGTRASRRETVRYHIRAAEPEPCGVVTPGCVFPRRHSEPRSHVMRTNGEIPEIVKVVSFPSLRTMNGLRRKERGRVGRWRRKEEA